jgi:hypothetical protein
MISITNTPLLLLLLLLLLIISLHTTSSLIQPTLSPLKSLTLNDIHSTTIPGTSFLSPNTLTIFGTYASDFNNVEYMQRLSHYKDELSSLGVDNFYLIVNGDIPAVKKINSLIPQPEGVTLLSDPSGSAGRMFGVSRGWRPDDASMSPYFKLYMMLFGFGCWATLPSVIGGYIGNPWRKQRWIKGALEYNTAAGYFPTSAIKDGVNMFDSLPLVGGWGRRPLELATLRLQNMAGISVPHWKELAPGPGDTGVLTQLGGLVITDEDGNPRYEWRDRGICDVADFEFICEDVLGKKGT